MRQKHVCTFRAPPGCADRPADRLAPQFLPGGLEAICQTRADQPGIKAQGCGNPRPGRRSQIATGGRQQEYALDVDIPSPMIIERVVEAKLGDIADIIAQAEIAQRVRVGIEEPGIIDTATDIGLEGSEIGEMILQRQRRRQ